MEQVATNSAKAWLLASRPKTLAAAVTPVIVGCALAYSLNSFSLIPALICLLFAVLMQIAANLINDLIDYLKGSDGEERLGPMRATAQGWITPKAMKAGIGIVVGVACLIGLSILCFTTWKLILVGLACVVFAYLYTSGPYPLSYNGWGDIAVVIFFGVVPVSMTCFVQAGTCPYYGIWLSVAVGMAINCLLIVNNYRDRDTDKASGKRTIIVKLGEPFGRYFYLGTGLAAYLVGIASLLFASTLSLSETVAPLLYITALMMPYLVLHMATWRKMCAIREGKALNVLIGESSRNMLVFAILTTIGLVTCK